MTTKFFALICVIGIAGASIAQAQSPTPGESPAQSPTPAKHRATKKAQTTASPAGVAASPSSAASPAASPKAKRAHKKAEAAAAASPSPGKFNLGDLFKPKTSAAAASPAAASRAPAKSASAETATNPPAPGGGHGLVWVNTESHVYHREGSHFYGTTKKGKYMTEAEAIKEGNKAAGAGH
jgi:pyruvate/2-oxoglutarate dehydrogenase complex dihydrolipoamide acyltransferase (E2) component